MTTRCQIVRFWNFLTLFLVVGLGYRNQAYTQYNGDNWRKNQQSRVEFLQEESFTNEENSTAEGNLYWSLLKRNKSSNVEKHSTFLDPVLKNHSDLWEFIQRNKVYKLEKSDACCFDDEHNEHCQAPCKRSLCPWKMVWDNNTTRVPQYLGKAVCLNHSSRCDFDFLHNKPVIDDLHSETQCDIVKQKIRVIEYNVSKSIMWPVACVCAKKRTRQRGFNLNPNLPSTARLENQTDSLSYPATKQDDT